MARGVLGLVTGLALGGVAAALASLALPDSSDATAASRDAPAVEATGHEPPPATVVPRSGLPRLRSDSAPADPARPNAE